jgi:hypothetical protein
MKASAWLLTIDNECHVAVGERELMHIIADEVEYVVAAGAPEGAGACIVWQNHQLPLFDVAAALRPDQAASGATVQPEIASGRAIFAIAAYQHCNENQVKFGAIPVRALPERIEVADDSGCDLPPELAGWRVLAHSCFKHERLGAVPILNLVRVFATERNRNDRLGTGSLSRIAESN